MLAIQHGMEIRVAAYNWDCPHCNRAVTITERRETSSRHLLVIPNAFGSKALVSHFIVCPNPECEKFTLFVSIHEAGHSGGEWLTGDEIKEWRLFPEGAAKPFPDYIPEVIRNDYQEACLISSDSPKASATLARRCLQGIIRDYWKVSPGRLVDEIDQIKDKTDSVTWNAIDAVRKIGNIGAHMEKDINVIVDVDPDEAELLISLVETLLTEWYVGTYEREQRMRAVVDAAASKKPPTAPIP